MDIKLISIHVQGQSETVQALYGPYADAPLANLEAFLTFIQKAMETKSEFGKVPLDKTSYAFATDLAGDITGCPSCLVIDFAADNEKYFITIPFDREDTNAYCRKKIRPYPKNLKPRKARKARNYE
jgi:multisubunit Na+/H+ antiporter MnhE subunit